MTDNENLFWSALEYEEKERSPDWFWALGIIAVTSSVASLIYGNYFFAVLLILAGLLLGYFAKKKPEVLNYELNNRGLKINNHFYPYENIKSFWVQTGTSNMGEHFKPLLFINVTRVFMPIITVPVEERMADDIHSLFVANKIEEKEMKEHPTDKIMDALGF